MEIQFYDKIKCTIKICLKKSLKGILYHVYYNRK